METLIFQLLKPGRKLPVVQGVWVQTDTWITPKQTPSLQHSKHTVQSFLSGAQVYSPGNCYQKYEAHEIPELSPQQSKADNCVWAYGCFRQALEDQRVGCSSCPGISLGRLLGSTFIFVCCLGSLFVVPSALKQAIDGIRMLWKNRFYLTSQKHLCEIWWTLLDLSENQEIFHSKCAVSTWEWRI